MGNSATIPTIVFNAIGAANQTVTNGSGTTYTVEWQKINTMANILVACVNTSGSTSTTETTTTCGKLFNDTQNGAAARPSDTLQAAVQMALHPTSNVTALYNLITTTPAFTPFLTAPPNDWTIGVSYTTSALGLGVNTGTLSTLDIDASGRVWFPSNAAGKIGRSVLRSGEPEFQRAVQLDGAGASAAGSHRFDWVCLVQRQRDGYRGRLPDDGSSNNAIGVAAEHDQHQPGD